MTSRRVLTCLGVLGALASAGCGSAAPTGHRGASGPTLVAARAAAAVVSTRSPGCTTAVARPRSLTGVTTSSTQIVQGAFGVVGAPRGISFVAAPDTLAAVTVLAGGGIHPRVLHRVSVPSGGALGAAITPDGDDLVLAQQNGIALVDVRRAARGLPGALLASSSVPAAQDAAGIEVAVSRDGRDAFLSAEGAGAVDVFDLAAVRRGGSAQAGYIGAIPVQIAPVGLAVSPDGRWLYATSEAVRGRRQGALSVIDVATAVRDPARAVVRTVTAGCEPVRVAVSSDGTSVWVTARGSDALLRFSAATLRADPSAALTAQVRVGEAPVGLALVDGGREIVTADSDRFEVPGRHSALSVVSIAGARPRLLGELTAGSFPRDMALEGSGTLLVTDFGSGDVQAIDTATLPGG